MAKSLNTVTVNRDEFLKHVKACDARDRKVAQDEFEKRMKEVKKACVSSAEKEVIRAESNLKQSKVELKEARSGNCAEVRYFQRHRPRIVEPLDRSGLISLLEKSKDSEIAVSVAMCEKYQV